jgi:hypothetical protein
MRLTLHAGIHRTGTTTVQRFLAENRAMLLRQGVLYPFDTVNHQKLAWEVFSGRRSGEDVAAQLKALADRAKPDRLLMSGEDFCIHKDLRWLEPVRRLFEIEAHFYLRRQDLWLMSWYNQHIKWPFDKRKSRMSADEFLQTIDDYYWLNFHWLAENWASAIGRENVHLHVFETTSDSVSDFCRHAAIDTARAAPGGRVENSSLPPQILEFVRHFEVHSFAPGERTRFLNAVRKVCQEQAYTASNLYSPAIRNLILARFAETNRRVAEEYLGIPDGRLFAEDRVAESEPSVSSQLPESEELMERLVVPLVRAIVTSHRAK